MKLTSQAQRVFKGIIFDVYQWKQKMFDGSQGIFEMLKRPDTALYKNRMENSLVCCAELCEGCGAEIGRRRTDNF